MNLRDSFFRKFDWLIFLPAALLSILGLAAIYSAELADAAGTFLNFKKQLAAFGLGIVAVFFLALYNYRELRGIKNHLYIAGGALLLSVLIFGQTIRGTRGWFSFGSLTFQPVEIAKIFLVIFLAEYFSREGRGLFTFGRIVKSFAAVAIFLTLILRQPDLGSSIILFFVWLFMLFASRVRKRHLIMLALIFIGGILAAWFFALEPYQKERVAVFLNPSLDPLGAGYNVHQSIIAIGSGGFWGKGLGFGSQSQLQFLPEARTDFIFAMIAEEMGFFMVAVVILLYALIFWRIMSIIKESRDDFTAYLGIGCLTIIFSEAIINIGMNLGLAPVTGLALPFMSLGGSSMVSKFIIIGLLESVRIRN